MRSVDPNASERVKTLPQYEAVRFRSAKLGMCSKMAGAMVGMVHNFAQYSYKSYTPAKLAMSLLSYFPEPDLDNLYNFSLTGRNVDALYLMQNATKNSVEKICPNKHSFSLTGSPEDNYLHFHARFDFKVAANLLRDATGYNAIQVQVSVVKLLQPVGEVTQDGKFISSACRYDKVHSTGFLLTPVISPIWETGEDTLVSYFPEGTSIMITKYTPVVVHTQGIRQVIDRYLNHLSCFSFDTYSMKLG